MVKNTFLEYRDELLRKYDNVTLLTYEAMVADYEQWLTTMADNLDLQISELLKEQLLEVNRQKQKKVQKENKHKHLRKGKPGDFHEKLTPETIAHLNNRLQPVLDFYNYSY